VLLLLLFRCVHWVGVCAEGWWSRCCCCWAAVTRNRPRQHTGTRGAGGVVGPFSNRWDEGGGGGGGGGRALGRGIHTATKVGGGFSGTASSLVRYRTVSL